MGKLAEKDYVVIVQCHLVKQRCSGYYCEKSFHDRSGGFTHYPREKTTRLLMLTCGGCCGRALHRKLSHLARLLKKNEGVERSQIAVQLSSCITNDSYHGPPCPHLGYLHQLVDKLGMDVYEGTQLDPKTELRRVEGVYPCYEPPL